MTYLRRTALVFSIILGTSVSAACADTTDIFCHQYGFAPDYRMNVSIDINASTVTFWLSTINRSQGETVSAKITDDTVTWSFRSPVESDDFTLDRKAGEMNVSHPNTNRRSDSWACKRVTPVL